MLQHYDQKIDPLVSIEQKHRLKMKRQQSPFVGKTIAGTISRSGTHESIPGTAKIGTEVGSLSKRGVGGGGYASAQTRFANNRASEIIRSAAAASGGPVRNVITSPKMSQTLPVNSQGNVRQAQLRTINSSKPGQMTPRRSQFLNP